MYGIQYTILYTIHMIKTEDKIFNFIRRKGEVSPSLIANHFSISNAMLHRHLKALMKKGRVFKVGSAPKTVYKINKHYAQFRFSTDKNLELLDDRSIHVTTQPYLDKASQHLKPYIVDVFGEEITVLPNVMSPLYEWSPYFLIDYLPEDLSGLSVLDVGSGCGLVSVHAYLRGASVVDAADISEIAVRNTQVNFDRFHMSESRVFKSDVFESVPRKKYDIVIYNAPFHNGMPLNDLERGVMDPGYGALLDFFAGINDYLTQKGRIYVSFSRSGNLDFFMDCINKSNFVVKDMQELNHWNDARFCAEDLRYNVQLYCLTRKESDPQTYLRKKVKDDPHGVRVLKGSVIVENGVFNEKIAYPSKKDFLYCSVPLSYIRTGKIVITENGRAIKYLNAGDFFGLYETAYFLQYKEKKVFGRWTLIADTDIEMIVFDKQRVCKLPTHVHRALIETSQKSRQPQPLTQLSELDDFVHRTQLQTLSNHVIVFHSHLLKSNFALIKHFAAIVGYNNVFVLEKPYSTVDDVFRSVAQLGVYIFPVKIDGNMPYDFSINRTTSYVWQKIVSHVVKNNITHISVISDGAEMLLSVPWEDLGTVSVTAVEQTQNGVDRLLHSGKKIPPTVSIGTAMLKKQYESPFIVDALVRRIKARNLWKQGLRFGVIGRGSLGTLFCAFLHKANIEYFVYDNADKLNTNVNSLEELVRNADVIVGTTGQDALRGLYVEEIIGEKTFVSFSSANREFQYLFDLAKVYPNTFDDVTLQVTSTFTAHILNGGYPINFDRFKERESQNDIVLTRMLLFAGFVQSLAYKNSSEGIIDFSEGYTSEILSLWKGGAMAQ